ncbi:MAG: hypothetical protein JXB88_03320 [Spirochaetales bacterium]|nr:hypothetical protein [Spirochaetales bacterium]
MYCDISDVQKRIQHITFSPTSRPSDTDITDFCEVISEEMDGKMQAVGIVLPVTDPSKLKILKKIAIDGVAAQVYRSVEMESDIAEVYQDLYEKAMKQIMERPAIISQSNTAQTGVSYFKDTSERHFKREEKDW